MDYSQNNEQCVKKIFISHYFWHVSTFPLMKRKGDLFKLFVLVDIANVTIASVTCELAGKV